MKTIKKNGRGTIKTIQKLMATVMVLVTLVSCSKDDGGGEPESAIKLGALSFDNEGDCDHSSGVTGTDFKITIPYNGTEGDTISNLLVKLTPSDSPSDNLSFDYNGLALTDGSGTLTWDGCWRFGENEWFDFELRIETTNGEISSTSKIRIDKPSGAN